MTHYAPRNVINATQIKGAILARSTERGDPENIQAWLKNHFFRYVIGNFQTDKPEIKRIETASQAQEIWLALGSAQSSTNDNLIPEWLQRALNGNNPLFWIDPTGAQLLALETQLIEFLHSRKGTTLEHKLMRINAFQAIALYEFEHQLFALQQQNGLEQHHPDATRCCLETVQGEFVELLPSSAHFRQELVYESQRMRHCIGQFADKKNLSGGYAEHYASLCETNQLRIFSFRTENHHPRITISARLLANGKLSIEEVKGKQNQPPVEKYHRYLIEFLNTLPCDIAYPNDLCRIGIVFANQKWQSISQVKSITEQARIAWQAPALAPKLSTVPRVAQWMLAAKSPETLSEIKSEKYIRQLIGLEK